MQTDIYNTFTVLTSNEVQIKLTLNLPHYLKYIASDIKLEKIKMASLQTLRWGQL